MGCQQGGAGVAAQRLLETGAALLADHEAWQRGDQRHMVKGGAEQGGGEIVARLLVFTRYRDEVVGGQGPIDGQDLHAMGLLLSIERIRWRQAARHQQRIHMAADQHSGQLLLGVRLVFRADDQQLIALSPGALLETLGELGVTGVLKVRQDEAQGPGLAAAQGGGAAVRLIVVGMDHGHHLVTGGLADAILIRLAVDHIAGGGTRDTGQGGDFIQFHHIGSV
ncbi:hypothetical protein D3C76_644410 [compost metagenome]